MRTVALIAVIVSFPLLGSAAGKDARFGSARTLALGGGISLYTARTGSTNATIMTMSPSASYFVVDDFAVGLDLGLTWISPSQGNSTTSLSLMPAVGYNIVLGPSFSVFPQAGIGYDHSSGGGTAGYSSSAVLLQGFVPFLVHVGNFFVGGGPILSAELSSSAEFNGVSQRSEKATTIGVATMLGGWL